MSPPRPATTADRNPAPAAIAVAAPTLAGLFRQLAENRPGDVLQVARLWLQAATAQGVDPVR